MSKTLKDQLYQALLRSMASGHLEPGLVLLEGNIAEIFGMSRSPVRQTLGRLHEEGAISRFEGRGYLVGRQSREVIRRSLTAADFRAAGGESSVKRTDSWLELAEEVERDVVLCSMKGRWELNELQMAKSLAVSRTTTHRILLQLQSLGVVEKVKYSSWNVVPLDNVRLQQLYQARCRLEPFMIARASESMPDAEVARFIHRLDAAQAEYPNVQGAQLDELENDLHHEALVQGGNTEILIMLRRTRPILLISKHLLGGSVELPQDDPFFDEHRGVFEGLKARDPDRAGQALFVHLTRSEAKVQERLTQFRHAGEIDVPGYLRRM